MSCDIDEIVETQLRKLQYVILLSRDLLGFSMAACKMYVSFRFNSEYHL